MDSPTAQLRALFFLNWVLAPTALTQLWRLLTRLGVTDAARLAGVVVLGSCLCGPWAMFASEAHLVAVMLLWSLLCVERWLGQGPRGSTVAAFGCASGLMILARLDTVWVAIAAFTVLVLTPSQRSLGERLRPVAVAGSIATVIVAPYLLWNLRNFGHLTSISGAIKVDLGSPRFALDGIGLLGVGILAAIWAGGLLSVLRAPRLATKVAVWLVPAIGALVSSLFYFVFSRGPFTTWFWYYLPHAVALALAVAVAIVADRLPNERPDFAGPVTAATRLGCVGLALVSMAFSATRHDDAPPNSRWIEARDFASATATVVPQGSPVATVDLPGVLGFVSERPVVALDGLMGDYDFQNRWRDKGGACTLESLGVSYLVTVDDIAVTYRDDDSVTLGFSSWLHREAPSELRGRGPLLESPNGWYALWRLQDDCPAPP